MPKIIFQRPFVFLRLLIINYLARTSKLSLFSLCLFLATVSPSFYLAFPAVWDERQAHQAGLKCLLTLQLKKIQASQLKGSFSQLHQTLSMKTEKYVTWGTWVAQSVECPTLDFGSGHDLMILEFKPHTGL